MPDSVTIETALAPVQDAQFSNCQNIVVIRENTAEIFVYFMDAGGLRSSRSTNGGVSFTESSVIGTTTLVGVSVWYDRWTPGDTTGNLVHISACDPATAAEDVLYFSWNVSTNSVGSTNNVIVNGGEVTAIAGTAASDDGGTTICKSASGELYIAAKVTTTVGWHVYQSATGATWTNRDAAGNNFNTAFNQLDDLVKLLPYGTVEDIIAIAYDDSANQIVQKIYDDSATSWGTTTSISTEGSETNAIAVNHPNLFACTLNKSNGDLFLVFWTTPTIGQISGDLLYKKHTFSTGTWGNSRRIVNNSTVAAESTNLFEYTGVCITRDQTNGMLMVSYVMGNVAADCTIYMKHSSDDGQTWSSAFRPNIVVDDHRHISSPAIMLNTSEGWYCVWTNDDLDDLLGLRAQPYNTTDARLPYSLVTGNVKNNAGSNVEGAEVSFFREETDERGQGGHGGVFHSMGRALTDSSGNYKLLVMDFMGHMNKYVGRARYDRADKEIFRDGIDTTTLAVGTLYASKFEGLTSGDSIVGAVIRTSVTTQTNMRVKCYADSSGSPGSLLAESGSVQTRGGVRSVKFTTPATVPASGIVWIAWETDAAITSGALGNTGLTSGTTKTVAHTYGAGPDPFGTPTNQTYGLWGNTFGNPEVDASIGELKD